jgi:dTDP-D-glucose 4,6-dehydratase
MLVMAAIDELMYKSRAVLVTGGAWFIGSHVVIRLVNAHPSVQVVAYDSLECCASLRNLDAVCTAANFCFVKGDIRSADLVKQVLESHGIDTIMHFAAQTHVDNSFGNSIEFTASQCGSNSSRAASTRPCREKRRVL